MPAGLLAAAPDIDGAGAGWLEEISVCIASSCSPIVTMIIAIDVLSRRR
jgi:hypothetical protein